MKFFVMDGPEKLDFPGHEPPSGKEWLRGPLKHVVISVPHMTTTTLSVFTTSLWDYVAIAVKSEIYGKQE